MQTAYYGEYAQAEGGHWWFAGRRRIIQSVIESLIRPSREAVLLEVGSGTGAMGRMVSRYGWFVGLDANWVAMGYARKQVDRLVLGRLEALPFATRSCDVLFACDVLEHVADHAGALRELSRICKPTGKLVLTVPAFSFLWSEHDEMNHHHRRYTRPQVAELLTQSGWRIEKLSYFNTLLFPPIAGVRWLGKMRPTRPRPERSDLARPVPRVLNTMLESVFAGERHLLRRWNLPFGVSLLGVASPDGSVNGRA